MENVKNNEMYITNQNLNLIERIWDEFEREIGKFVKFKSYDLCMKLNTMEMFNDKNNRRKFIFYSYLIQLELLAVNIKFLLEFQTAAEI